MTIGELLKKYRIEHEKTQKEWVGNIVSPSFYAKVEKNLSRISAEDLLGILRNNQVSIVSFVNSLDSREESVKNQESEVDKLITEAYYQGSKSDLEKISHLIKDSDLPDKDEQLMFITAYIALLNDDLKSLDEQIKSKLKNKIFSIVNFNETNAELYSNFMELYDLDSNLLITKRILQQFKGTNDVELQSLILAMISNLLFICVENKRYDGLEFFIKNANEIIVTPELFFYKNVLVFVEDLIDYHVRHDKASLEKCKLIIENIKLTGITSYGNELSKFLKITE